MRQLLRQSDTVSKPNNVLSVPFQLNVGTKLFFFTPRGTTFGLLLCTDAFNTLSQCRVVVKQYNCRVLSSVAFQNVSLSQFRIYSKKTCIFC